MGSRYPELISHGNSFTQRAARGSPFLIKAVALICLTGCTFSAELQDLSSKVPPPPPVLTIENLPIQVSQENQESVRVTGTCPAPLESFLIVGPISSTTVICDANGTWQADLDLSAMPDGMITVTTDQQDHQQQIISFDLLKDTQPPVILTAQLNSGEIYTRFSNIPYVIQSSDAIEVYITDEITCATGGAWSGLVGMLNIGATEGLKKYYFKAKDALGNTGSCEELGSVILDTTLPVLVGLSNDSVVRTTKNWSWTCSDVNPCQTRFLISQNLNDVPNGSYSNTFSAEQISGDGTFYLCSRFCGDWFSRRQHLRWNGLWN